jgi:hypothetical protein
LVDGAAYFSAVADALEAARDVIYIAAWWLTPEARAHERERERESVCVREREIR